MLPNWYGIKGIGFEWRGSQNDPMLHYKGHVFNAHDMQDGLWENYRDDLEMAIRPLSGRNMPGTTQLTTLTMH